jgi:RES domain-containing protein
MNVFRIAKSRHARDLSGMGAKLAPGRWNKSLPVLYTASSAALAALEVLVHVPASFAPRGYEFVEIVMPDDVPIETFGHDQLPSGWDHFPPETETRRMGEEWIQSGRSLGLRVPSVIIPAEYNVLINPFHPDHPRLKIVKTAPFVFDGRLFKPERGGK